jgi:hypothetical protein
MDEDLALFGVEPQADYDGFRGCGADLAGGAALLLDTKAEAPCDPFLDMQAMLLEMTMHVRVRFLRFQRHTGVAARVAGAAVDVAARKLAQTDAKAAIEAVSLIVRTLEKIDSLQRTLIAERVEAEAAAGLPEDEAALAEEFDRLVEARVKERLDAAKEEWLREDGAGGAAAADARAGP